MYIKETQQITVYEHFVPQFYMKYWGSGNDNKHLYQYLKASGKIVPCCTDDKNCCNGKSIYEVPISAKEFQSIPWCIPNYVEHYFRDRERIWSMAFQNIFNSLESGDKLCDADRCFICEFVASLIVRNPDVMSDPNNKFVDHMILGMRNDPRVLHITDLIIKKYTDFEDVVLRPMLSKIMVMPQSFSYDDGSHGLEGYMHVSFFDDLRTRSIFILRSVQELFFFSDRPVIIERCLNFEYIFCPLNPKYAVVFVLEQYVDLFIRLFHCAVDKVCDISEGGILSLSYCYKYSPKCNRIFGKSEEQLCKIVSAFDKCAKVWPTPYDSLKSDKRVK